MKTRDIVIGIVVLAAIVGLVLRFRGSRAGKLEVTPTPSSIEDKFEESFKVEIPEDADKVELKDVAGGGSTGIASRSFKDSKFSHMVLADLPSPEVGSYYQGWLQKGEEDDDDFSLVPTGRMSLVKGGYLIEYESNQDLQDFNKVVVSQEKIADSKVEKRVLEGNF
jgi:hypothetical protein